MFVSLIILIALNKFKIKNFLPFNDCWNFFMGLQLVKEEFMLSMPVFYWQATRNTILKIINNQCYLN